MRLEFSGTEEINAPRVLVWKNLLDPDVIASSADGVESVETIDDTHFKVVAVMGVGPIKLRFHLDVRLGELQHDRTGQHSSARMSAAGKAPGSDVQVKTCVELEKLAPDRTRLTWTATSNLRGTIASIGARLLKGAARQLIADFWTQFAAHPANHAT